MARPYIALLLTILSLVSLHNTTPSGMPVRDYFAELLDGANRKKRAANAARRKGEDANLAVARAEKKNLDEQRARHEKAEKELEEVRRDGYNRHFHKSNVDRDQDGQFYWRHFWKDARTPICIEFLKKVACAIYGRAHEAAANAIHSHQSILGRVFSIQFDGAQRKCLIPVEKDDDTMPSRKWKRQKKSISRHIYFIVTSLSSLFPERQQQPRHRQI